MHGMTGLVASKEVLRVTPDLSSSGTMKFQAHVKEIFGDCGVNPIAHKEIFIGPFEVSMINGIVFNMVKKTITTKDRGKESAPFGLIVGLQIQSVGNEGFNGDSMNGMREGERWAPYQRQRWCRWRETPGKTTCQTLGLWMHQGLEKTARLRPHRLKNQQ
jgi:hypothetical protein